MPFTIVHVDLATKLNENKLKLEENNFLDFLVGNIIVDCNYELKKKWLGIDRDKTHYYENENYFNCKFPSNFYENELKTDFNFLKLWYYYHLITDRVWADIKLQNALADGELRKIYQSDRKNHADNDFFLFQKNNKYLIDKLYNYSFKLDLLPSVYQDISIKDLQDSYKKVLDFMMSDKECLEYWNCDKSYFSYQEHLNYKQKALDLWKKYCNITLS